MRQRLLEALTRERVLTRPAALTVVARHVLDDAVSAGAVRSMYPGVYALAGMADRRDVRRRGALLYRPQSALSHVDALEVWGYRPDDWTDAAPVHLTVSHDEARIDWPGLVLHRRRGFHCESPGVLVRRGLRVVRLEQAVVESWALLPELERRAPALVVIRERRTTGARLLSVLEANGRVQGAAAMRRLFRLAAAGCHSPLELWGHEQVFTGPDLSRARLQFPIDLPTGRVYLDRYYEAEMVDVELDGAAYHGEPGQRERDIRRDAALAAMGIQTVRFSHPRLFNESAGVRHELRDVLAVRRAQLRMRNAG